MSDWWGTRSSVSTRLRLEVEAMRATFGGTFRLVVPSEKKARQGGKDSLLYWDGEVEINLSTLPSPIHRLKIEYPADYPYKAAEAYVLSPKVYSPKHQYEDGQLCLFNPKDGEQYGWNPAASTAVTVTSWAIQWLYAYYTWKETEIWPGEEERVDRRQR